MSNFPSERYYSRREFSSQPSLWDLRNGQSSRDIWLIDKNKTTKAFLPLYWAGAVAEVHYQGANWIARTPGEALQFVMWKRRGRDWQLREGETSLNPTEAGGVDNKKQYEAPLWGTDHWLGSRVLSAKWGKHASKVVSKPLDYSHPEPWVAWESRWSWKILTRVGQGHIKRVCWWQADVDVEDEVLGPWAGTCGAWLLANAIGNADTNMVGSVYYPRWNFTESFGLENVSYGFNERLKLRMDGDSALLIHDEDGNRCFGIWSPFNSVVNPRNPHVMKFCAITGPIDGKCDQKNQRVIGSWARTVDMPRSPEWSEPWVVHYFFGTVREVKSQIRWARTISSLTERLRTFLTFLEPR